MIRRRCRAAIFQALHAIPDQVHLHAQPINLIDAIGQPLQLPGKNVQITRIVPRMLCGWQSRPCTQLGANIIHSRSKAADFLVQSGNGALDFGELPTMRLEHAGVVRDLRLQAGYGARPDIVGQSIRSIGGNGWMS